MTQHLWVMTVHRFVSLRWFRRNSPTAQLRVVIQHLTLLSAGVNLTFCLVLTIKIIWYIDFPRGSIMIIQTFDDSCHVTCRCSLSLIIISNVSSYALMMIFHGTVKISLYHVRGKVFAAGFLICSVYNIYMMASSNGNIFRVTGHLCKEFTGQRWIPRTKASYAEFWSFLWSALEWTVE